MILTKAQAYLMEIKFYQKKYNCYTKLVSYFTSSDNTLLSSYSKGLLFLPTHNVIDRISTYFFKKYEDKNLNLLFIELAKSSKYFYSSLIVITINSSIKTNSYDKAYAKNIRPLGQIMINLLKFIKLRINHLEDLKIKEKTGFNFINKYINYLVSKPNKNNHPNKYLNTMIKICFNHSTIKNVYYLSIILSIILIWLVSCNIEYYFNIDPTSSAYLNILFSMCGVIFSIMHYPFEDFGKVNIYGEDEVAYNYKSFFNNTGNSRSLKLVAFNKLI